MRILRGTVIILFISILVVSCGKQVPKGGYKQDKPITFKVDSLVERNSKFIFSFQYPVISGMVNEDAQDKINEAFMQNAKDFLDIWEKQMSNVKTKEAGQHKYVYMTKFRAETPFNHIFSAIFEIMHSTGGPHPNMSLFSMNYNLNTGERLYLKDLFAPKEEFIYTVSDFCIEALTHTYNFKTLGVGGGDIVWITNGASAKESNYRVFMIKKDGLEVVFSPNQVAPASEGTPEILVPYNTLKEKLNKKLFSELKNTSI